MVRRKEILDEVYTRCNKKTHETLTKVSGDDKMINKELSQIKSKMDMNSSRLNPNMVPFMQTMAENKKS